MYIIKPITFCVRPLKKHVKNGEKCVAKRKKLLLVYISTTKLYYGVRVDTNVDRSRKEKKETMQIV
jgi:hypothetical protein